MSHRTTSSRPRLAAASIANEERRTPRDVSTRSASMCPSEAAATAAEEVHRREHPPPSSSQTSARSHVSARTFPRLAATTHARFAWWSAAARAEECTCSSPSLRIRRAIHRSAATSSTSAARALSSPAASTSATSSSCGDVPGFEGWRSCHVVFFEWKVARAHSRTSTRPPRTAPRSTGRVQRIGWSRPSWRRCARAQRRVSSGAPSAMDSTARWSRGRLFSSAHATSAGDERTRAGGSGAAAASRTLGSAARTRARHDLLARAKTRTSQGSSRAST